MATERISGSIRTNVADKTGLVSFLHDGATLATVMTAIEGVINGLPNEFTSATVVDTALAGSTAVAPVTAQAGNVWRIHFTTTAGKFVTSLPTADSSLLTAGSNLLPSAALTTFKTALDGKIVDRFGNAGAITKVRYVNEARGN